ncbi:hypothetical protein LFZ8_00680 [Salmonella enterica subsp. enterica serovar Djakarta str. S-1087]|nr:hypothetical protein LFZ8_00680 [Salmonella enterica subsp. enterica serovar Djakarta str. S-1087]ECF6884282.1 hypothetical protein [Salmonella enterica subsp. enterica]ECH7784964.1 hypothetical protein [Salmonella enterica subsp. enterica]ECJ4047784.1 hypothetical protein [Salmonella enterica subsp. enterica]MIG54339.1 hypothetical protein [Salmonella enterica subsp. enterica serovar Warragul]
MRAAGIIPIKSARLGYNRNVAATAPENPGALSLTLSPQELAAIEAVFPHDAAGPRYWPKIMSTLNR